MWTVGWHRTALRRRGVPDRPGLLRDLRPGPEHRRGDDPGAVPRHAARRTRVLHAAQYQPSPEVPDDEYPLTLTTGRVVYQFHTRTKTGRAPQLNDAAPEVWVEVNPADARPLGIVDGDTVAVRSRRGTVHAPARLADISPGTVFIPFHYGYWDTDGTEHDRAANELTLTSWDAASKQPIFKVAAVRLAKVD